MNVFHEPVLVREVLEGLRVNPKKRYIDATVGGGGHLWEIVKRGGDVLGIDLDEEAIAFTRRRLEVGAKKLETRGTWKLVHGNFCDIDQIAKQEGFESVDGILFDLGVSSHQLNTPSAGFSYRFDDAPFDLRFDKSLGESAHSVIDRLSEEELYEILATFGEEQRARAIAHAVVRARTVSPLITGKDIRLVVARAAAGGNGEKTLSRVYQAFRIVVNDELRSLKRGLAGAETLLQSGGRLVVISFHSLEDRIVKQFIRASAMRSITKKPVVASAEEVARNRRSRSAKLRIAEKL